MRIKLLLVALLYVLVSSNSYGANEIYTKLFSDKALGGYDAVSYFQDGGPLKGQSDINFNYKKAIWYFVNQENKALFQKNPSKYSPQYGGHCAWAVAEKESLVSGDPLQWSIVESKLYLNYNETVKNNWLENPPGFIKTADNNWPKLID